MSESHLFCKSVRDGGLTEGDLMLDKKGGKVWSFSKASTIFLIFNSRMERSLDAKYYVSVWSFLSKKIVI